MPENPDPGFPSQSNKQEEKNPPKAPQGGRRRKKPILDGPEWKPERFAGFWAFYPRGEKKQAAIAAWDKLKPSDELIDEMASALKWQTRTEQWQEIDKIPYPSSWLNGERWTDQRPTAAAPALPAEPYTRGLDVKERQALLYGGD